MKFIKITLLDGRTVTINANEILYMEQIDSTTTTIYMKTNSEHFFTATIQVETILDMIKN